MFVITFITPVDIQANSDVTIFLDTCSGLCNPYVAGNYTLAVWTDVEQAAMESEVYAISDSIQIVNVDVQPPTVSTMAQYTIEFITYATITANVTTITVTFPPDTKLPTNMMPGQILIDDDAAFGSDLTPPLNAISPVTISVSR